MHQREQQGASGALSMNCCRLSAYVDERLLGPATGEVQGLVDRIAGRLRSMASQHAQP